MVRLGRYFAMGAIVLAVSSFLTGAAFAQAVSFSPNNVSFGALLIGTTSMPQQIVMTNTGTATLTISAMHIMPVGTFTFFSDCGDSLAAGASCNIYVVFAPTSAGQSKGAVSVSDNAPGSPQSVQLAGTGAAPGASLSPSSLNFGTLGVGSTSSGQTVTLTNQGVVNLSISSITTSSSEFAANSSCPATLAPGSSCTVSVTLTPASAGTRAGTLNVNDNDRTSPQLTQLYGVGTSGKGALSSNNLTFADQLVGTTSAPQNLTLTNNGSNTLSIINIFASGDYSQTNTCGTSVASGSSCTITVTFTPSATGTRAGFVTFTDTDPTALQTVSLTGTAHINTSTVTVSPKAASVTFREKQQFKASINGSPSKDVTWLVDGVTGGNQTVGTINTSGVYTPPQVQGPHAIEAISNADHNQTATVQVVVSNLKGVFTYHNDIGRTGQNTNEIVLTTGNVNQTQFGKLFAYQVDGVIRAQPLYMANVNVPGKGYHNIIYVADEHDTLYAFDADGRQKAPLWRDSFIDPANGITSVPSQDVNVDCPGVGTEFGISSTPVIDPARGRIFVATRTKDTTTSPATYHQYLHALDVTTGAELSGSPVEIQASMPGIGEGSSGGTMAFDPLHENNRPGLLLSGGAIYIGYSSVCDLHPYHGWVIGYDEQTLAQKSFFNTTPNGASGGIWQSAAGLTGDSSGNIYFSTSNGMFNVNEGGTEYGESVVKVSTTGGTLTGADYFTPFDTTALTEVDADLSSFGTIALPDQPTSPQHLLLAGGKQGVVYLLNRDAMGGFRATDDNQVVQTVMDTGACPEEGSLFGLGAYWQNQVFLWACGDNLRSFPLFQGLMSPTALSIAPANSQYPAPTPSVSSNGASQGIVWAIYQHLFLQGQPAVLFAFDGGNISRMLYNSSQAGTRDQAGPASKGPVPTIANGKVYVGTASELDVYGLLP